MRAGRRGRPAASRLYEEAFRELEEPVEVTVITDGRRALVAVHRCRDDADASILDIVIQDLDLPGMSGVELVEELREVGLIPALPVVVCSQ